jgi:hypothetical protein
MHIPLDVRLHAITGLGNVLPRIRLRSLVIGVYAIVQRDALVAFTGGEVA